MIKAIRAILPKDRRYYVAVSMGIDSVAAVIWLRSKGYRIKPVHFNHRLRPQNDMMEQKFWEMCRELGMDGHAGIGKNLKTEVDCRNARLEFFSRLGSDSQIITAHHLNDWVENYLLNCFRGQPGFSPMPVFSKFGNFTLLHPFLSSRKIDFKTYLERNGWMRFVVEDETNLLVKGSRRNWIRNTILPEMKNQKLSLEKFASKKINKILQEIKI